VSVEMIPAEECSFAAAVALSDPEFVAGRPLVAVTNALRWAHRQRDALVLQGGSWDDYQQVLRGSAGARFAVVAS